MDVARLIQRAEALKGDRQAHEHVWRDCFDYSIPQFGSGFSSTQNPTAGELQQKKALLLDGTAGDGLTTMADGFMGGLTPANSRWFALDVQGKESQDERRWLDEAADAIFENIRASNFEAEAHDCMLYLGGAGWFALYVDEHPDGGYYFEAWPLGECFIGAARKGDVVDTVAREYEVAASALVEEHGSDKVSEKTRSLVESNKGHEKVRVLRVIEPRRDYMPGSTMASQLPWASYTIERDAKHLLKESGYHEMPVIVPRWRRIPGSVYATGPMSDALPDTKTLQEVRRWEFAAAETVIAPPLVAEDDGVLNPRMLKIGPRKVIVANSVDSIKPLITGARVEFGQILVEDVRASVRRSLMADLFTKLLEDPRMTATQVHAIVAVLRQRMGPRFGRMESEYLQRLVERCYGIAFRAGVLGKPPERLLRVDFGVRYLSPLARAQKLEDVSAMDRYETSLLAVAEARPQVLDVYLWDDAERHRAELLGVPAKLIPDAKQVAKDRAASAAAAQQQQQNEIGAMAQAKGAETMAETMAGA